MIIRKCLDCNVDMKKVKTDTISGWGDYEVVVKGIDAYICPKCGEKVFDSETTYMLQELGKSLSKLNQKERPDVLNVEEVTEELRISEQTVYNMIKDGHLKAFKAGREWRFNIKDIKSIKKGEDQLMAAARRKDNKMTEKDIETIREELDAL
jgi:excisionase family DNA binding protein/YgiT-type zinc finger domain-containing protein